MAGASMQPGIRSGASRENFPSGVHSPPNISKAHRVFANRAGALYVAGCAEAYLDLVFALQFNEN